MTQREAQIYQWIVENPMISQEDLAKKAGITRSSVAVHISNLMKKGYILGKGYITNELTCIVVIGAASRNVVGCIEKETGEGGFAENCTGNISDINGGAARNIAHHLRMLGSNVKLITAFGDDYYAKELIDNCNELGIDINDSLRVKEAKTARQMQLLDRTGKQEIILSDNQIFDNLAIEFFQDKMDILNDSQMIVLDTNLSREALEYIISRIEVPVFVESVSQKSVEKLENALNGIHTLLVDAKEAGILTGQECPCGDEKAIEKAAFALLEKDIQRVFIVEERGIYCADRLEHILIPLASGMQPIPDNSISFIELKEAVMAALANAYSEEYDLQNTIQSVLESLPGILKKFVP